MPAVSQPHAEHWNATAKAVNSTIKKRGITFAAFVAELGEASEYHRLHSAVRRSRPPSGHGAEKRVKRITKWLAEHGARRN